MVGSNRNLLVDIFLQSAYGLFGLCRLQSQVDYLPLPLSQPVLEFMTLLRANRRLLSVEKRTSSD